MRRRTFLNTAGIPTEKSCYNLMLTGPVAQLVEQRIENPRVGSSILPQATKILLVNQALSSKS